MIYFPVTFFWLCTSSIYNYQPVEPVHLPTMYAPSANILQRANDNLPKKLMSKQPIQRTIVPISVKCPTELIGISTPSSKMFHTVIDFGTTAINNTNLLSVELVQVCN